MFALCVRAMSDDDDDLEEGPAPRHRLFGWVLNALRFRQSQSAAPASVAAAGGRMMNSGGVAYLPSLHVTRASVPEPPPPLPLPLPLPPGMTRASTTHDHHDIRDAGDRLQRPFTAMEHSSCATSASNAEPPMLPLVGVQVPQPSSYCAC